ncbi:hypothetical protein EZV62_011191 [Acer yangbiense]|uniref:Uncharacterized protein n=1 Tax=Acer yangbiense TaxID=1000413 RepID=A0A5C7I4K2_9ROSI|nr:hypothetical protein EZV62_011191 [Acer yangbiense]
MKGSDGGSKVDGGGVRWREEKWDQESGACVSRTGQGNSVVALCGLVSIGEELSWVVGELGGIGATMHRSGVMGSGAKFYGRDSGSAALARDVENGGRRCVSCEAKLDEV